jgi:CMP-N,N'-diacetyllegionaminic acid synthase
MAERVFAVILARAGSKGVPGKNVATVGGRPCIAWTIDAARQARTVNAVAVSSDDPRALAIARDMGVGTIMRPQELATDTARVDDAARHAVEMAGGADIIVVLYANVPVRPDGLIDRAVDLLRETGADSVQSYTPVGKYHPWWTARLNGQGEVVPWEGEVLNHNVFRRQDLPLAVVPDGGVLAVTRRALFLEIPGVAPGPHAFFGLDRRGVLNPEGSVVDIDSRVDLLVADALLKDVLRKAG